MHTATLIIATPWNFINNISCKNKSEQNGHLKKFTQKFHLCFHLRAATQLPPCKKPPKVTGWCGDSYGDPDGFLRADSPWCRVGSVQPRVLLGVPTLSRSPLALPLWMSPIQNKLPSSPHSHRHAHTAHLPPPQWSRCSAELVRRLVRFSKENNDLAFSPLREGYLISPTLKESGFWANSIIFLQKKSTFRTRKQGRIHLRMF